jgi:hypothetical protein
MTRITRMGKSGGREFYNRSLRFIRAIREQKNTGLKPGRCCDNVEAEPVS